MSRTFSSVIKGMAAGMAAGIAVGAVGYSMMQNNTKVKKTGRKVLRTMEDLLGNMSYMMR